MNPALKTTVALILLACGTAYAVTPAAKEFTDGNKTKFNTSGHAKAKGLKMTIAYPNSWAAEEGERPNIVQKFVSDGGRGLEGALIITKTLPLPPGTKVTEQELKEFFAPAEMKGMVPDGATFLGGKLTKIEGLPAGMIEYSMRQERAGMTIYTRTIAFIFIHGSTMVQLQCFVGALPTTPTALAQRMAEFMPLFTLMANSIVLEDEWK